MLAWVLTPVIMLGGVNAGLYYTAPDLFTVDLAKGPYTEANNLELTRVYARAITLYKQVIERFPASEYAILSRIGIANSSIGLGRPQDALEHYTELIAEFGDDPNFKKYRYTVLEKMSGLYRDAGDNEKFQEVFASLKKQYPDSSAVREGSIYLEQVQAGSGGGAAELPADFPFAIADADFVVPQRANVGEDMEIRVVVKPVKGKTPDFSLMTTLGLYKGFNVVSITPVPRSTTEYWGKRAWSYPSIDQPLEVKAIFNAKKAGKYTFDLDLESNFNITELGLSREITVE
ncbi:hypothetical protein LMTR3_19930 [Bradyrhizobium sp. LMTR 3]|nr:hypothetical protein LMTR3_19930 [Bradyrhizobium sp. LMTR 3]